MLHERIHTSRALESARYRAENVQQQTTFDPSSVTRAALMNQVALERDALQRRGCERRAGVESNLPAELEVDWISELYSISRE